MKLSEIPKPKLEEIRRFIEENPRLPITSKYTDKTLQKEIERRFGYKLSPAQISRIKRGAVKLSNVVIPVDQARELEKQYGSLTVGVKKAISKLIAEIPKVPEPYNRAYQELRGRTYEYGELIGKLREMGYENPAEVLKVFSGEGVMMWEGKDKIKILNKRRLTDLELFGFLGLGGE